MEEVLECTVCGKIFSMKEALEKHAEKMHGTDKVIEEGKGLFNL